MSVESNTNNQVKTFILQDKIKKTKKEERPNLNSSNEEELDPNNKNHLSPTNIPEYSEITPNNLTKNNSPEVVVQINIPKPKSAEFAIMESKLMIYEIREWMKELPTDFKPFEWFFLLAHKRIFLALLISNILRMLGYIIGVVVLNNFLGWKNINYVVVPASITLIILFFVCICYKNKLDKTYSFIIMVTVSILFEMIRIREIHKHIPISMYLEIYNMHLFTTGLAYFYCLISEKHAQKFKYLKAIASFMIGGLFALITGIVFFYEYYYQLEIYLFVYLFFTLYIFLSINILNGNKFQHYKNEYLSVSLSYMYLYVFILLFYRLIKFCGKHSEGWSVFFNDESLPSTNPTTSLENEYQMANQTTENPNGSTIEMRNRSRQQTPETEDHIQIEVRENNEE